MCICSSSNRGAFDYQRFDVSLTLTEIKGDGSPVKVTKFGFDITVTLTIEKHPGNNGGDDTLNVILMVSNSDDVENMGESKTNSGLGPLGSDIFSYDVKCYNTNTDILAPTHVKSFKYEPRSGQSWGGEVMQLNYENKVKYIHLDEEVHFQIVITRLFIGLKNN